MKNLLLIFCGTLLASGCASNAFYNSNYEPRSEYPRAGLEGQALILTSAADDALMVNQSPSSFTGSATTINVAMGAIVKEIAISVFDGLFEGGAKSSNTMESSGDYRVVVTPSHRQLDFQYNQADNLGFAITPKAEVTIGLVVSDPDGVVIFEESFPSGLVEGKTYAISGSPSEKINEVIHMAVGKAMARAARELRQVLK